MEKTKIKEELKQEIKVKFDTVKMLLKSATYVVIGAAGDTIIQLLGSGFDLRQTLLVGLGVGCLAGIKNIFKVAWNVDLDLINLKK